MTHLYVLRSPQFTYATFTVMYARKCVCVSVYISEHVRTSAVYSIELKFGMFIIGHRQTNCIDFGECRMNTLFFFTGAEKNSYTLQPMESNCKKYASV